MQTPNQDAKKVEQLVREIRPLFAGKSPGVQGAALADLLAMWLAGHVYPGEPMKTERVREAMLELHLMTVRALIPVNHEIQIEPQLKARRPN